MMLQATRTIYNHYFTSSLHSRCDRPVCRCTADGAEGESMSGRGGGGTTSLVTVIAPCFVPCTLTGCQLSPQNRFRAGTDAPA